MAANDLARMIDILRSEGWIEDGPYRFHKGEWRIVFDTSSWMELGTEETPRIFDVPVPRADLVPWTLHLIDHLFATNDRLRGHSKAGQRTP